MKTGLSRSLAVDRLGLVHTDQFKELRQAVSLLAAHQTLIHFDCGAQHTVRHDDLLPKQGKFCAGRSIRVCLSVKHGFELVQRLVDYAVEAGGFVENTSPFA